MKKKFIIVLAILIFNIICLQACILPDGEEYKQKLQPLLIAQHEHLLFLKHHYEQHPGLPLTAGSSCVSDNWVKQALRSTELTKAALICKGRRLFTFLSNVIRKEKLGQILEEISSITVFLTDWKEQTDKILPIQYKWLKDQFMPEQLEKFRIKDHEVSFTEPNLDPCFEGHLQSLVPSLHLQEIEIIEANLVTLVNVLKFNLQKSKTLVERIHKTVQYVADLERLKTFKEALRIENLKGLGAVVCLSPYLLCLEELNFYGFKTPRFALQVLGLILPKLFNLKSLSLINCEIEGQDAEEFIASLGEKAPLIELVAIDLSENPLDDDTAENIIRNIETKTRQRKLPKFELICL